MESHQKTIGRKKRRGWNCGNSKRFPLTLYPLIITIAEKTKFSQSLEHLHDFDDSENYKVNAMSALTVGINDVFSVKTSYEIRYTNQVPSDIDTTDRILTVALVADL